MCRWGLSWAATHLQWQELMSAKAIIVSAADEQYFTLVRDLFASIRAHTFKVEFDLAILDVGLSDENRVWLKAHNVRIERAGVDVEFPGRLAWEAHKPGFRALSSKLFMRRYFPGYDVYMWMDADVWVQTPDAINSMLKAAAETKAIYIACELDRSYKTFFEHAGIWQVFRDWYKVNYGEPIAAAMTLKPMLNVGVWAMAKDSPVWEEWIQIHSEALQRLTAATDTSFMAEQLGLNILAYIKKVPHVVMPATFNWMTFHALPMLDKKKGVYVEPLPPYAPISQFHLTRPIKEQVETIACTDGTTVQRPLTYRALKG